MKYGFIGCGNMASAILQGMLNGGISAPEDVLASAPSEETRNRVHEKFGVKTTKDNVEVSQESDVLFLAVKPNVLGGVIEEIRRFVSENTLIVSIVSSRTITDLEILFDGEEDSDRKLVRVMPNTPAMVGAGMSAVCSNSNVTEEELRMVLKIFRSFGSAELVPEKLFDAVTAVSGSSPAYAFLFLEALADGAVALGMPRKQAYVFAAQSLLGSAKMVLDTGMHPGELKDMVCSPGGTTIDAVRVLEEKGLRGAVMDAVIACGNKSKSM
ncbi:MAG: pyrroline-5-carboxylate reductase [Eubacteriales bacterium]|nr:pyrroline-5-carboxylate reductase [Eubacteriales bacterium]